MRAFIRSAAIAAIVVLDRLTKLWAMRWLSVHGPVRVFRFFYFTYVEKKVPEDQLCDLSIAKDAKARLDKEKPFGN